MTMSKFARIDNRIVMRMRPMTLNGNFNTFNTQSIIMYRHYLIFMKAGSV